MSNDQPVALITGAARRIGAEIANTLHNSGFNLVLHYNQSQTTAQELADSLNDTRPNSVNIIQADLCDDSAVHELAAQAVAIWQRMDALINNASSFYPTPVGSIDQAQWLDLIGTNLKAPLFLSQALAPALKQSRGCIINIADVHGERPLSNHPVYCIAKAGNIMLTKTLAKELAPEVRVNGIAPGAILWPERHGALNDATKSLILDRIALHTLGSPQDIAQTIKFLILDAPYITGQVLAVDGGRSLVS